MKIKQMLISFFEKLDERASSYEHPPENTTHLERLEGFFERPRVLDGQLLKLLGPAPRFNRQKWLAPAKTMPILYTCVVQADDGLYRPSKEFARIVIIFTYEKEKATNIKYLNDVSRSLREIRLAKRVPQDAVKLMAKLKDNAFFIEKLPTSITGDTVVYIAVETIDAARVLPNRYMPANRILPAFIRHPIRFNRKSGLQFIQGECYE